MSRWQFVPERLWVGAGAALFGAVLGWKGIETEHLLGTVVGLVFTLCGVLILFGRIEPPKTDNEK